MVEAITRKSPAESGRTNAAPSRKNRESTAKSRRNARCAGSVSMPVSRVGTPSEIVSWRADGSAEIAAKARAAREAQMEAEIQKAWRR